MMPIKPPPETKCIEIWSRSPGRKEWGRRTTVKLHYFDSPGRDYDKRLGMARRYANEQVTSWIACEPRTEFEIREARG